MKIIGHQKIIDRLNLAIAKDCINHAYLFYGSEKLGKFTVAMEFALAIASGKPMDSLSDAERKKYALDIITVAPVSEEKDGVIKEKVIDKDAILRAQQELLLFPVQGKSRILIVDRAEKMNAVAQNSLLKILEDPNSSSVIILVSNDEDRVLQTIHSRCQKTQFFIVGNDEMKKSDGLVSEGAVELAMGRPGIFVAMKESEENMDWRAEAQHELDEVIRLGIGEKLKMAESFSKNIPRTIEKIELWIWILRLRFMDSFSSAHFSRILRMNEALEVLKRTNANSRMVLEEMFLNI